MFRASREKDAPESKSRTDDTYGCGLWYYSDLSCRAAGGRIAGHVRANPGYIYQGGMIDAWCRQIDAHVC
jgi:hypothetical protein